MNAKCFVAIIAIALMYALILFIARYGMAGEAREDHA